MIRTLVYISALAVALPAHAGDSGNRSPFEIDLRVDLPVTLACGVLSEAPVLFRDELQGPWCGLDCEPGTVNAFDRNVIGNDLEGAAITSDIMVISNIALPHVAGLLDQLVSEPVDGWSGYGKDTLVLLETLAVNMAVNQVVKYAVRRPRPYVYDHDVSDAERTTSEAAVSFYSAHTSNSFCMATAYSYIFTLRHPDSPLVIPVWLSTHALAAGTAGLRVFAGKHFWSDIIVGAVVGSGIGLLVPYLHLRKTPDSGGSGINVAPLVLDGGLGVVMGLNFD